ncbi:uncharacterized protein LOC144660943 [Oculina patagonica]
MRRERWSSEAQKASQTNAFAVHTPEGPTLRSSLPYKKVKNAKQTFAVNIDKLTTSLRECQHCKKGPLDLSNICEDIHAVIKVKCRHCLKINTKRPAEHHRTGKRGPPTIDINSLSGLGAIHSGLGHSHYTGLLSTMGLPTLTSRNFKTRERESGSAIETVAKESCEFFTEEEKKQSSSEKSGEGKIVKVGVSYDMGWRKRGRSHDSSSGAGTAIGLKSGKVISYATRNTMCRICDQAEKKKEEPGPHSCRKNHQGSSKSMEVSVAVELFSNAVSSGVSYSTYVGDDDSTTESRLKTLVNYPIEKWSDINHVSHALGSRLYAAKGKVKGLTPTVIGYIQKCFSYCIKQNNGNPKSLQEGLSNIVSHAFGEHNKCKDWCSYQKDPENYTHSELPGGKDLNGDDLRACIEDALQPFLSMEAAEKMAPAGSSQRNECVNSVIGSKVPKIRHYGGSESSDYRTAAGVAQFKEGHSYVAKAAKKMGVVKTRPAKSYVRKMDKKRAKEAKRKSSRVFKRARRDSQKKKSQKTVSIEKHEGVTYESGIGFRQTAAEKKAVTEATITDLKGSLTKEEFNGYAELIKTQNKQEYERQTSTESEVKKQDGHLCFVTDFCCFIQQHTEKHHLVLIAHNGDRFDFPVLINALKRNSLLDEFLSSQVLLLDSLKLITMKTKKKSSISKACEGKSLSALYEFLFHEKFAAHDAQEDVASLQSILFKSPLKFSVERLVEASVSGMEFAQKMQSALEAKSLKSTLQRLPISDGMKEKLGQAGFDLKAMEEITKKGGSRRLLAMLALPETYEQIGRKKMKPTYFD